MRSHFDHCAVGLLLALMACLLFPPPSFGGGYTVSACFGVENAAWAEWEPSPFATAYTACPGGVVDAARPQSGEGLMVRNVVGRGFAPRGAAAALAFEAPAGTSIGGVDFDAKLRSFHGWHAGVMDGTRGSWLWCGAGCRGSAGRWIHQELRGLVTQRVQAFVRCAAQRCRRDARHGYIALRNARVHLSDQTVPQLGGLRGSLIAAAGAWRRGVQSVAFDARDNSGIRLGRVELDRRVIADHARACDFTRRVPCSNGPTAAAFDTRTWADGAHVLRLSAQDAGGNWAAVARTVRVDNTPPPEPAPTLDGGDGWNPAQRRTLVLALPGGQAAPITRARVRACRAGGRCAASAPALVPARSAATATVAAFDGPGEYSLRVALEDAAGNVGPYAAPVTLRFDDTRPGAPDLSAADAWHSGGALPLSAEGDPPVSGIRGYRVRIGGREAIVATSIALDELPEGATPVQVSTVSGAGVESTAVRTMLKLDRSPPIAEASGVPAGWSREPVHVMLRGRDQPALSGVRSLAWTLDRGDEVRVDGESASLEVAADGRHELSYRAIDGAGNASEPRAFTINVDRTPPETVAFEAPDPDDPRRVRVVVADRTSGVARGRIELRRAGAAWKPVRTTFEHGRLVALLDDAVLRAGAYRLRARVADAAGNETVGSSRVDGTPATLTLPLRRRTRLEVRRIAAALRARLTAGGEPLAGREVTLSQRLRGRRQWRPVCAILRTTSALPGPAGGPDFTAAAACTLRTDGAGRVYVGLRHGPSRTLRLSYAGDAVLLPATGTARVRTRARARLRRHPRVAAAGGPVTFTGRLLGGHVPRGGKLVELQARVTSGWRTFATVRTGRRGRLRHTHYFAATSGGRTFWFRLRIRREAAYPYERATSRAVSVHVR